MMFEIYVFSYITSVGAPLSAIVEYTLHIHVSKKIVECVIFYT